MCALTPLVVAAPVLACATPVWSADFLTVDQARLALFPGSTAVTEQPVRLTTAQRKQIRELSGVTQRSETQAVWKVSRDGKDAGWFIVDQVIGKHEYIVYAAGIAPDGKVTGIEILSYRETHGGQVQREDWRRNFVGKKLADPFKLDADIPNISGATLSCRNLMNGVKRLLALWSVALPHE